MSGTAFAGITALVVDDDPVMLEIAYGMLKRLGVGDIHVAPDGQSGLESLSRLERCELILCDLDMPRVDGIEFLRLARQQGWQGGMLVVSGTDKKLLDAVREISRAQSMSRLETLAKPLDFAHLAAAAQRVVAKSKSRIRRSLPVVGERDLRSAIEERQLYVDYQPKLSMNDLTVVGCEALVRWQHPDSGRIGPEVFIPVAERFGMISEITAYVAEAGLKDLAVWNAEGLALALSINVSMRDLSDLEWPDRVADLARGNGVSPSQVTLEVTESAAMADLANSLEVLARFRLKHFGLSIDDFGTGFSSLEKLSYIPFTELKVDRRFVQESVHNHSARSILESSIRLAQDISIASVAEGVETAEQLDLVRGFGCTEVQGFLLGKPMGASLLLELCSTVWPRRQA